MTKPKARDWLTIAIVLIIAWLIYRRGAGKALYGPGHATPEDAISYGWAVLQAGITGWQETSPDGSQVIMHTTGWTGDPYTS